MRRSLFAPLMTLGVLVVACAKPPSAPTSGGAIVSIRIDGPARVAPGEAVTYTAVGTYGGGATRNVSGEAVWSPPGPPAPMYFTGPGAGVGLHSGEVVAVARIGVIQGSTRVLVLEKGTYKVAGTVTESSGRPLAGVSIDVLSGTGIGLHATANSQGAYALYGVAGPTQLRVSGDGFIPQTRDLVVNSDAAAEDFGLAPKEPAADISGDWTMTLKPSPSCSTPPPDIAKGRAYQLRIVQQGTGLTFEASGATVTAYNQRFNSGVLFGTRARLWFIGDTDYGDWSSGNVTDQLSPTESMQFDGAMEGDLTASEVAGTMNGDIVYWDSTRPSFAPNWYCRAKDHRVILRK